MYKKYNLKKVLGYTAVVALMLQLALLPGVFGFGADKASAQTATSTSLTVNKVVVGGDAVAADFDLFVDGMLVTNGVATTTLGAGTFTITESADVDYAATFSGDCAADGTITLTEGMTAECTITNTFIVPTATTTSITVSKSVVGGDMAFGDFELFIGGVPTISGVPLEVTPGTYTITETEVPGYTPTFTGDCAADGTITVEEGEELTCIMTNTFEEPVATTTSLTITKVVDGGDMVAADFPLFVDGIPMVSGVATTTLPAGTYTITETSTDDYVATFSGDCAADGTITVAAGDDLECVITNTFVDPTATTTSLTVTKVVNGGNMSVADFPLFVNGMSITSGVATTTLAAGTYFITESGNANYSATFSGACAANGALTLVPGVDAECTITNTFINTSSGGGSSNNDDDDDNNINITVEGSDANATGGEVNINIDGQTNPFGVPFSTFFPPGQVLGAQSFIPAATYTPFPGQVLGAQSYVPGFPSTGGDPTAGESAGLPNGSLIALAGLLAISGAGLMLSPRSLTSRNTEAV